MCGRFALAPVRNFKEHYGISDQDTETPYFSHNIAPSDNITTIIRKDANTIQTMKWGWWKGKVINARSETVDKKPWFFSSLEKNRCIIPVTGFYEWKDVEGKKIPFRFHMLPSNLFSLAGLYHFQQETKTFECLILTMDANTSVRSIHKRMPVILPDSWESYWLSPHADIPLSQLMVANEALLLHAEKMSSLINSPKFALEPEVIHEA